MLDSQADSLNQSEALRNLTCLIGKLDYVQNFKNAEAVLRSEESVWADYEQMKEFQKEAVLFKKLEKNQAFKESSHAAQLLEKGLKGNLLVQDYFSEMEDVNDLLQYVTGEIERKFNEGL